MMNENIRTMVYIGEDDWGRPVYKCKENGILWKDVNCGRGRKNLCSCSNSFDGEPDCPIREDLEIHFEEVEEISPENKFNYQLLDRLRCDCEYYLGYGNRNKKNLWAGNEKEQIEKMKELYSNFKEDQKPDWLTYNKILEYEKLMIK